MTRVRAIRIIGPLIARFPGFFYWLAPILGWAGWETSRGRRRNLIRNMLPLCGNDPALARKAGRRAYQNVARYWIDVNTLPRRNFATFERDHIRIINGEHLRALDVPGPIVLVSAHTGNAELICQALTYRGRPFVALVETLTPPEFSQYLLRLRSSAGSRFYEATFGGVRACLEALRRGELVAMMGDRDIQGTGLAVDLCGRRVRLPRGPWELARRSGAVVIPVLSSRTGTDHFDVYVNEPFTVARSADIDRDVSEAVERWAAILEQHLRRDPGQWIVLEDFWTRHGGE